MICFDPIYIYGVAIQIFFQGLFLRYVARTCIISILQVVMLVELARFTRSIQIKRKMLPNLSVICLGTFCICQWQLLASAADWATRRQLHPESRLPLSLHTSNRVQSVNACVWWVNALVSFFTTLVPRRLCDDLENSWLLNEQASTNSVLTRSKRFLHVVYIVLCVSSEVTTGTKKPSRNCVAKNLCKAWHDICATQLVTVTLTSPGFTSTGVLYLIVSYSCPIPSKSPAHNIEYVQWAWA